MCSRIGISFRLNRSVGVGSCFLFRVRGVLPFTLSGDGFPLLVLGVICSTCSPWALVALCSLGWSFPIVFATFAAEVAAMAFSS